MTKKEALKILLEHSFLLTEEQKQQIMHRFDNLTDEQVDQLAKFLALEKKNSIEHGQEKIDGLNKVISDLDSYIQKQSK